MSKLKKGELRKMILNVLKEQPDTRNSDVALTIAIWKRYYPRRLKFREQDNKMYIALDDLFDLPREDNIKRIRAIIQNDEGRYLPTNKEVAIQRRINMQQWQLYITQQYENTTN